MYGLHQGMSPQRGRGAARSAAPNMRPRGAARSAATTRVEVDIRYILLPFVHHQLSLHGTHQHLEDLSQHIVTELSRKEYRWSSDLKKKVLDVFNERSRGMRVAFIE